MRRGIIIAIMQLILSNPKFRLTSQRSSLVNVYGCTVELQSCSNDFGITCLKASYGPMTAVVLRAARVWARAREFDGNESRRHAGAWLHTVGRSNRTDYGDSNSLLNHLAIRFVACLLCRADQKAFMYA